MSHGTNHVGTAALGSPVEAKPRWRSLFPAPVLCSLLVLILAGHSAASDCLPITAARQHVGETKCITGKVVRVEVGSKGVHFIDFCEDQMACPFSVIVFASDLKDVGDVRRLAGQTIEIHGPVKLYDGRAEIILNRVSQLTAGSALIPPLPKNYDVEKQGHYSVGSMSHPKPARATTKKRQTPTVPAELPQDDQ